MGRYLCCPLQGYAPHGLIILLRTSGLCPRQGKLFCDQGYVQGKGNFFVTHYRAESHMGWHFYKYCFKSRGSCLVVLHNCFPWENTTFLTFSRKQFTSRLIDKHNIILVYLYCLAYKYVCWTKMAESLVWRNKAHA
jgi:hypothetical protein